MVRHAVAALPVPAMVLLTSALTLWFGLLHRWPESIWLSAGLAVGVLGAGASLLFDEVAADVVDTLPRSLPWRTAARLIPAAALVLAWSAGVGLVGRRAGADPDLLLRYGVGVVVLVAAACTALRAHGQARPSAAVGSVVLLTSTFLATSNPVPQLLPLFTLVDDPWIGASRHWWTAITAGSAAVLVGTLVGETRCRSRPHVRGGGEAER